MSNSDTDASEAEPAADSISGGKKQRGFDLVLLFATGTWLGYSPIVPGTCGALWGLPLAWGIAQLTGPVEPWSLGLAIQLAIIAVLFVVGVPLCTAATVRLGGTKDPSAVVWDEIASMPIVFLFVPLAEMSNPMILAAGFVLHRIFDITKPPPCRQLEGLADGLGIMADDFMAAIYACGVLHLMRWLIEF